MSRALSRLPLFALCAALAACGGGGGNPGTDEPVDAATVEPRDASAPGPDAATHCEPRCTGGCGDDGCGQRCPCPAGSMCNEATNACESCTPETNQTFCTRLGAECGSVTAKDNCGRDRTWNCGSCADGETCDAATHTCTEPCQDTDAAFCARQGRVCGGATGVDACGEQRTVASCGDCGAAEICLEAGQCCAPETDADLCTAAGKLCGEATATDRCGRERKAQCGGCTAPEACNARGYCSVPGVPLNDECARAEPIVLDASGNATVVGDTSGATNGGESRNCGGSGVDVVYALTLGSARDVELTLDPSTTTWGVLHVRADCGDKASELRCADGFNGDPARVKLWNLAAGTYYVWIDAFRSSTGGPDQGAFTLQVHTSAPAAAQQNDTCAAPVLITPSGGAVTLQGDTTSARNDYTGTCGTMDGSDLVYAFTLAADASVAVKVTRDAADTGFLPAVYLRRACASTDPAEEMGCVRATGATASFATGRLTAGTWHVIVDGTSGSYGRFTLEVTAGAPLPEDCGLATALNVASGSVTVQGDTTLAARDATGSCGSFGPDLVYSFTTTVVKNAEILVTPPAGSTHQPSVYVRSDCAQTSSEVGCFAATAGGKEARLALTSLPAGTWYVFVDGAINSAKGAFTLTVNLADAALVPNDTCAAPTLLTLDASGHATATGDSTFAFDDYAGSCGGTGRVDVVYKFVLANPSWVTAKVTRDAAATSFTPVVYLRSDCALPDASAEAACAAGNATGVATATALNLPAGTWYAVVDASAGLGPFTLDLQARPAVDNDTCASAKALTFDASGVARASNDTSPARDDGSGTCRGTGKDLVYSFETTATKTVEVRLSGTAGSPLKPAVFVRRTCADSATEVGCNYNDTAGGTTSVLLPSLAAGTYFVWVDGSSATSGPFELQVSALDPVSTGDTCAQAQPLPFDANGRAVVQGQTKNNDTKGSCNATMDGGDVVYSFSLPADAYVAARVTRSAGNTTFKPTLYLRRDDCASATAANEVFCDKFTGTSTAPVMPVMTARLLPAGNYFLFVDGLTADAGQFTLEVESRLNTTCPFARELSFDAAGVATATGDTSLASNDDEAPSWCGTATRNGDLVYAFTLTDERQVDVAVTPDTGSNLKPVVFVRSACGTVLDQVPGACARNSTKGGAISLSVPRLPAGRYHVWIDSSGLSGTSGSPPASGPFALTVTQKAAQPVPASDTCAAATTLAFDGAGHASVTGADTTYAWNDASGTCQNSDGGDVVYAIHVGQPSKLVATLSKTTTGNTTLYLRSDCSRGEAANEISCAYKYQATPSQTTTLTVNALQAGTYYLWVDGYNGSAGPFSLSVDLTAPVPGTLPANESCAFVQPLSFTNNVATASGTTLLAQNEATGSCADYSSADVVYSFTTTSTQKIIAEVAPTATSTLKPAVYVRRYCGSPSAADELACVAATAAGGTARAEIKSAPAGTYYVWIDGGGIGATSGDFGLTVTLDAPAAVPQNDTCTMPVVLLSGAPVSGDTSLALPDYGFGPMSGACGPSRTMPAPELVYAYTPTTTGPFTVKVAPQSTFDASLWVTTRCGSDLDCMAYMNSGSAGTAEQLTVQGVAGTTYYLIVDAFIRSYAGTFSITVQ